MQAVLEQPITGEVCFGAVPELGLRSDRQFWLDRGSDDGLLAARVLHLEQHATVPHGTDCVQRLRTEEASAWHLELETRRSLGVAHAACPTGGLGSRPSVDALEHWLETSTDTVPTDLRASHRQRCGGGLP